MRSWMSSAKLNEGSALKLFQPACLFNAIFGAVEKDFFRDLNVK